MRRPFEAARRRHSRASRDPPACVTGTRKWKSNRAWKWRFFALQLLYALNDARWNALSVEDLKHPARPLFFLPLLNKVCCGVKRLERVECALQVAPLSRARSLALRSLVRVCTCAHGIM